MDNLTLATHNQKLSLWIERIKECQASNQTVADWCKANHIGIKTYYYWMRKIKREAFEALPAQRKARVTKTLVPTFAEIPKINSSMIESTTAIILQFGTIRVEIQNGADATTIEQTLRILHHLC